jgi:hypothetical protein
MDLILIEVFIKIMTYYRKHYNFLCLPFMVDLSKLKTKAPKGGNNHLEVKYGQLLVNPFHVGLHNVDGYADNLTGE